MHNIFTATRNGHKINTMQKYRCRVCGYMYDPQNGDATGKIEPGTAFEDLPDNWKCPVCGVGAQEFRQVDQGQ